MSRTSIFIILLTLNVFSTFSQKPISPKIYNYTKEYQFWLEQNGLIEYFLFDYKNSISQFEDKIKIKLGFGNYEKWVKITDYFQDSLSYDLNWYLYNSFNYLVKNEYSSILIIDGVDFQNTIISDSLNGIVNQISIKAGFIKDTVSLDFTNFKINSLNKMLTCSSDSAIIKEKVEHSLLNYFNSFKTESEYYKFVINNKSNTTNTIFKVINAKNIVQKKNNLFYNIEFECNYYVEQDNLIIIYNLLCTVAPGKNYPPNDNRFRYLETYNSTSFDTFNAEIYNIIKEITCKK